MSALLQKCPGPHPSSKSKDGIRLRPAFYSEAVEVETQLSYSEAVF